MDRHVLLGHAAVRNRLTDRPTNKVDAVPMEDAIVIDSKQLGQIEVLSPQGDTLRLECLWQDQTIVLSLIRHFG